MFYSLHKGICIVHNPWSLKNPEMVLNAEHKIQGAW